jgi:hypothetical protein
MALLGKAAKVTENLSKVKKSGEEFYEFGITYIPPALEWVKSDMPKLPPPQ